MGLIRGSHRAHTGLTRGSHGVHTGLTRGSHRAHMGLSWGSNWAHTGLTRGSHGAHMGLTWGSHGAHKGLTRGSHGWAHISQSQSKFILVLLVKKSKELPDFLLKFSEPCRIITPIQENVKCSNRGPFPISLVRPTRIFSKAKT